MEQFLSEAAWLVKLFGGGGLALLILRQILLLMQEWRKAQADVAGQSKVSPGGNSSGAQNTAYWIEKIHAILKALLDDLVLPVLLRLVNLVEVVSARLIAMDMEHRGMFEAQMKEHAEAIRQAREIAEMVRARHERDARARSAMEISLANYSRDIAELGKMVEKVLVALDRS